MTLKHFSMTLKKECFLLNFVLIKSVILTTNQEKKLHVKKIPLNWSGKKSKPRKIQAPYQPKNWYCQEQVPNFPVFKKRPTYTLTFHISESQSNSVLSTTKHLFWEIPPKWNWKTTIFEEKLKKKHELALFSPSKSSGWKTMKKTGLTGHTWNFSGSGYNN